MRQSRYVDEFRKLEAVLAKFEETLTPEEMESETYAELYM